jgi:hypothetical protein
MPEKATPEELKYMERMRIFIENRQAYPPEELLQKYGGQWVAWSCDGTHIVAASSEGGGAVHDLVVAAGIDPSQVVFSYVPGE